LHIIIFQCWNIYNEIYSTIEKNEILSFTGKLMELELINLSQVSQVQKGKGAKAACFLSYMEDRPPK
jgi:hypothetical protein